MFVDSLVKALIPALVLTAFALARRYFPAMSARKFDTAYSVEELSARFAFTQWLVGASMLLIGGAMVWVTHSILVRLNQFFAGLEGPSDWVLLPQSAIWWFLPGFGALALAWEVTLRAWCLIGDQKEVALYNYWTSAKAGFDSTKVLRILAVVVGLPIGIFTALAIPEHAALRGQEIRARGYGFSNTETYRYSEARRMTVIEGFRNRDGSLERRAGVILDFSDGRRWSSAAISDFEPSVDPKLVRFLQMHTGLQPEYASTEAEIPGGQAKK